MATSSSSAGTVVRAATPADLADVAKLLSARDAQQRDPSVVNAYLWGLNPEHTCTWLAYVDGRPVGISMVYLRDMHWPVDSQAGDSSLVRAGYWAHLFVEPEFRRQMIYPQLVLAMLRGMAAHGISLIYTATRQPQVAEGHQKLGFALVGMLPLRLRPLRPFRLVAKHKGIKPLTSLSKPLDAIAGKFIRRRKNIRVAVESVALESPRIEEIVALMNAKPDRPVRHDWTSEEFGQRFATTLDGTDYQVRAVIREGKVVAALVSVLVERGNNIKAGVLLSFVASASVTNAEVTALLADAEDFAYRNQAELMLSLDDSVDLPQLADSSGKYLTTKSETYHLLVYPNKMAQLPHIAAQLDNWAFDFADHDAF